MISLNFNILSLKGQTVEIFLRRLEITVLKLMKDVELESSDLGDISEKMMVEAVRVTRWPKE